MLSTLILLFRKKPLMQEAMQHGLLLMYRQVFQPVILQSELYHVIQVAPGHVYLRWLIFQATK